RRSTTRRARAWRSPRRCGSSRGLEPRSRSRRSRRPSRRGSASRAARLSRPPVLLTISTTHRPATDLGFLLHKRPERVQAFPLPVGTAHVLYPEVGEERCTAALVLDIDPVGLVRRGGHGAFALAEYVNDRPYVASSLLSVALVNVFKSA